MHLIGVKNVVIFSVICEVVFDTKMFESFLSTFLYHTLKEQVSAFIIKFDRNLSNAF